MKLDALLASLVEAPVDADQIEITSITADSRKVAPGTLFAALPGSRIDGASFIPAAIASGASAIVTGLSTTQEIAADLPIIRVQDPRRLLAQIAARFYGRQPKTIVAVTGTSGKTSVADFTRQIFTALGHLAASIGTIGVVRPDGGVYGSLTTPDPVTLHAELASLADAGVTHLAFEASSHGLDQRRLDGVELQAAAFTNLGRDHLDYHPTVEDYFKAKQRLFDTLLPAPPAGVQPAAAVINADDPDAEVIVEIAALRGLRLIRTGGRSEVEMCLLDADTDGFKQRLEIGYAGKKYNVSLPLIGRYQASNAMLAAGLAISVGESPPAVFAALAELRGVRGRLEVVATLRGAIVVVDYAHKPDALQAALAALRPFASGKLISVFGCGGDRDRGKRPIMGAISAAMADMTIITDDNPRSEDPAEIRKAILKSCPSGIEIGDRHAAIAHAMAQLETGDVLLIAGKGHETGQIIGDHIVPFSDHDAVHAVSMDLARS